MDSHADTTTETRRQAIQARIDAGKSQAERNRLGQFATPNRLAIEIAKYVASLFEDSSSDISFADPAIGTGSFYSAAVDAFGHTRIKRAVGVELDSEFADAARRLWTDAGLEVVNGDFTRIVANRTHLPTPNVILANPPYVRHHHLTQQDKERLQRVAFELAAVNINGLSGLYVYFVLLATAWMQDGGVAAWLIPSEFMDVNYGTALKTFLTNQVTLIRIHRFEPDDVQFGDALVSSVVVVFRKSAPAEDHAVDFTYGGTLASPHASELIPCERLQTCRKWTAFPRHAKNDRHAASDGSGPMLGDFFRIRRGIATGCNKFFVIDRSEANRRNLPAEFLRPILPSPRHLKTTVIDAGEDGYPAIARQLCLIDCGLPESIVEVDYPTLWEYLKSASSHGVLDRYLVTKRSPWYKQEQRKPAEFLCTYMGRGSNERQPFRFIWNRSAAIGTNLYLMLYPQGRLSRLLYEEPSFAGVVHGLLSQVTGHELRGEGRVYGGGLNKIEPRELARISARSFVDRWPELGARANSQGELFD